MPEGPSIEYKPEYVPLSEVPAQRPPGTPFVWKKRFDEMPAGKAAMLTFNTKQRAHQVRNTIRTTAYRYNVALGTRIIHGVPAIHGTDKWLLYFWKP